MKHYTLYRVVILSHFLIAAFSSCSDRLDIKPNQSLLVPNTLKDFRAVLDINFMNTGYPYFSEAGADNYFLLDTRYNSQSEIIRGIYSWNEQIPSAGTSNNQWYLPYRNIMYANVVLEGLEKYEREKDDDFNDVKGSAHFLRAFFYHQLAQLYCKQYDLSTASQDLGLPIKLRADINDRPIRSTLREVYIQIITDLEESIRMLPFQTQHKTRPSKQAANAMMARVLISMNDYENALNYADAAIQLYGDLLDYKILDPNQPFPFQEYNLEVLFAGTMSPNSIFNANNYFVDSLLYDSYDQDDLRKTCFYSPQSGYHVYKGSYSGSTLLFSGITNSEIYLTRAECYARLGNTENAMKDLNMLLEKRYNEDFVSKEAANADEALIEILSERRKELAFRDVRWMDLRRLNKDPLIAKALVRNINGQVFTLSANDPRYVYPIPDSEVFLTGIEQNNRASAELN